MFADAYGLDRKPAESMLDKLVSMRLRLVSMIEQMLLPDKLKTEKRIYSNGDLGLFFWNTGTIEGELKKETVVNKYFKIGYAI